MIPVKTEEEIQKIRESAAILVSTFKALEPLIKPGIETQKLDQIAEDVIRSEGCRPAFKGYRGFPASICVSIDSEVVHGIPGTNRLKENEILSLDIGVEKDGYFSDAAKTYGIGEIDKEKQKLIDSTRLALHRGIGKCQHGNRLSDVSHAIQKYTESKGFSVVKALVGHGIGQALHEEPQIPNYGLPHRGPVLSSGMVFAIEPMINIGSSDVIFLDDGWTVKTTDGKPSAHFEHTVLVTDGKPEILTLGIDEGV